MNDFLVSLFSNIGLSDNVAAILAMAAVVIGVLVVAFLANLIAKKVIIRLIHGVVRKTKTTWDDVITER